MNFCRSIQPLAPTARVYTHAPAAPPSVAGAPISAVVPSADTASLQPNEAAPISRSGPVAGAVSSAPSPIASVAGQAATTGAPPPAVAPRPDAPATPVNPSATTSRANALAQCHRLDIDIDPDPLVCARLPTTLPAHRSNACAPRPITPPDPRDKAAPTGRSEHARPDFHRQRCELVDLTDVRIPGIGRVPVVGDPLAALEIEHRIEDRLLRQPLQKRLATRCSIRCSS